MRTPFIKASQLKQGDTFKRNPRNQRVFWVQGIATLAYKHKSVAKADDGKIKVDTWCANSFVLDPEEQVFLVSPAREEVRCA